MQDITLRRIRKRLDRLCKFLDKKYSINDGGCCLVTYFIALNLDRLGIKYDLVIYDDKRRNSPKIAKEIFNKSLESSNSVIGDNTCIHYTLKIYKGGIINNMDTCFDYFKYIIHNIGPTYIKWIYDEGYWNEIFDISNSRSIQRIIDRFFNRVIYRILINETRKNKGNNSE